MENCLVIILITDLLSHSIKKEKKPSKDRKYLICGHLSPKQLHLYVCIVKVGAFVMSIVLR